MDTDGLIQELAAQARPVTPLAEPWRRAGLWLALSIPYVALVVLVMSPRPDLPARFAESRFQIEEVAALVTAVLAAVAAFTAIVPGRGRSLGFLPLLPLAVWLASLGAACVQDWRALGAPGLHVGIDWGCLPAAALAGLGPAVVMVLMLRRGAPLYPRATLAMGALAVGALAQAGMQLFHIGDISVMLLVWHFGSVAALAALAALAGGRVLRWPGRRAGARADP